MRLVRKAEKELLRVILVSVLGPRLMAVKV